MQAQPTRVQPTVGTGPIPLSAALTLREGAVAPRGLAALGGKTRSIEVAGRATWQLPAGQYCFYLPWNDDNATVDPLVRRSLAGAQTTAFAPTTQKSTTRVTLRAGQRQLTPFLVTAAVAATGTVTLDFVSKVPRDSAPDMFIDNPIPQLLTSCDYEGKAKLQYETETALAQRIAINNATGMTLYSQNRDGASTFSYIGNRLSLVLVEKKHGFKTKTFTLGQTQVRIVHRSDEFLKLEATLREAFRSQSRLFGRYPYPVLNLVESSSLEPSQTLGIVSLNRPAQDLFRMVQMDVLNWYHWVMVKRLAFQWFGSMIEASGHHDHWLLQGLAELGALESLRANPAHFNLFNFRQRGYSLLSFDYVTIQNLKAAILSKSSPNTTITNHEYVSYPKKDRDLPFLYVKHASLLRYLAYVAGYSRFERFISQMASDYKFRRLSPKQFVQQFSRLPSPFSAGMRKQLGTIVATWWRSPDWPDYRLADVTKTKKDDGTWRTEVTIRSTNYGFPIQVRMDDREGFSHFSSAKRVVEGNAKNGGKQRRLSSRSANWPHMGRRLKDTTYTLKVAFDTQYQPRDVVIDPQYHLYDSDRYNNNDDWFADVHFFPGNARTLADDGYTVFWLPFISRRSGQNTSLALHSIIMRYMHGYIYAMVDKDLSSDAYAYQLVYSALLYDLGLDAELSLEKDVFDASTRSFKLTRANVLNFESVKANMSTILRHRGNDANVMENHATGALQTRFWLYWHPKCKNVYTAEYEETIPQYSDEISYHKTTIGAGLACEIGRYGIGLSLFGGKIASPQMDLVPDGVKFRPQEPGEANLRVDSQGLEALPQVASVGLKLSMPMIFDLPHWFLVLKNSVRIHHFTDYGYAPESDTRYLASGLGLSLPLGGDFVGAGPIALSVIDINLVLYTKVGDVVGKKPKLLVGLNRSL